MARPNVVFRDNALLIQVNSLKNKRTNAAITAATITAQLYESDGTTTIGSELTLTHSASGNYYAESAPDIPTDEEYGWVEINIASPYVAQWRFRVDFRTRAEVY